jgi:delilah
MHHKSKKLLAMSTLLDGGVADSNNNEEKYSLRRKRKTNNNLATHCGDEEAEIKPKAKNKPKPKAAPLSKYRRKTANARERTRMREINTAFETLRTYVPLVVSGVPANEPSTNEKLTKITTLRLAMKYITILSDILEAPSDTVSQTYGPVIDSINNGTNNNNNEDHNYNNTDHLHDHHLLYQQHEPFSTASKPVTSSNSKCKKNNNNISNYSSSDISVNSVYDQFDEIMLTPQPAKLTKTPTNNKINNNSNNNNNSNSKSNKKSKTNNNKNSKQSRKKSKTNNSNTNSNKSNINKTNSNKNTTITKRNQQQQKNQQKLAKIMKNIDLTPCLSFSSCYDDFSLDLDLPLDSEVHSLHLSALEHTKLRETYNCKTNSYNDSLELGLLLESDGESLNMSEPCLSPLSQLDSFNPFNDLLHTDFNEQAALEMFLT